MKKIQFTAFLLFFTQLCIGQYFKLTPSGFVSEDNTNYVVVDVPGVKQQNLYKNVLNALSSIYKDPKEVLSLVEGESITIKGYEEEAIANRARSNPIAVVKTKKEYDISYSMTILFKDDKIRFNSPTFDLRTWYEGGYKSGWASDWQYLTLVPVKKGKDSIFDKNGEIKGKVAYDAVSSFFNSLVKQILEKSQTVNDW